MGDNIKHYDIILRFRSYPNLWIYDDHEIAIVYHVVNQLNQFTRFVRYYSQYGKYETKA